MPRPKNLTKQNPKLLQKSLKDGRASLYLEYYLGRSETPVLDEQGNQVYYTDGAMAGKPKYKITHERKFESLNLYLWLTPRDQKERQQNKNTLALAEKIRFEREQQFLEDREGYRLQKDKENNFHEYFKQFYADNSPFTPYSRRAFKSIHNRFLRFLKENPKYQRYAVFLRFELVTPELVTAFVEWLKGICVGEGIQKCFYYFRKVLNTAIEEGQMKKNPAKGIIIRCDTNVLKKSILTPAEVERLMCVRYKQERPDIQRAFIFSLFTGIRYCDVVRLTYANVDFTSKILSFNQIKSKNRSSHSGVVTPLNDDLAELIGMPRNPDDLAEKIFPLPILQTCNKHLQQWVKAAGINKHITWHCARHTFAVNVLSAGANIKTVSSLLGHASIKMTEKYLHVIDNQKKDAINSLGRIKFNRNEIASLENED